MTDSSQVTMGDRSRWTTRRVPDGSDFARDLVDRAGLGPSIQMQRYWYTPIGPLSDRCFNAWMLLLGRFIRRRASE